MNMSDPAALSLEQSIARQVHAQEHKAKETRDPVLDLERTIARQVHTLQDDDDGTRRKPHSETEDLKKALGGLVLEKGHSARSVDKNNNSSSSIEHAAERLHESMSGSHKFSEALQNLNHAQKALASPGKGKYTLPNESDDNSMNRSSSHKKRELSQKVFHASASEGIILMDDNSLHEQIVAGAGSSSVLGSLAVLEKVGKLHSSRQSDPGCSYSSFDLHNLSRGDNLILKEDDDFSDVDIDEADYCSEEDDNGVDDGIDETAEVGTKEKGKETPVKRHNREAREHKKRMHETRKKREHGAAGIEKKHSSGKERSDRVGRTKRGGRRASAITPASTAGAAGPALHRAATTDPAGGGGGKPETAAPFRRTATGGGRGHRYDRTRDIAGKQLQQRMSSIVPPVKEEEQVPDAVVEEQAKEETEEDMARRAQIDALKKQALARGPSVSTAIANKIRNDPALLEKFLLEVHEEEELTKELVGLKGPPSVINGVDGAKSEVRRGLGEKSDGKRKVRASNRSSVKTSSAIEPGTYRNVIGSSSEH